MILFLYNYNINLRISIALFLFCQLESKFSMGNRIQIQVIKKKKKQIQDCKAQFMVTLIFYNLNIIYIKIVIKNEKKTRKEHVSLYTATSPHKARQK